MCAVRDNGIWLKQLRIVSELCLYIDYSLGCISESNFKRTYRSDNRGGNIIEFPHPIYFSEKNSLIIMFLE